MGDNCCIFKRGEGVLLYINLKGKIFLILNLSKFILNKLNFKIVIDQGGTTPPSHPYKKKLKKLIVNRAKISFQALFYYSIWLNRRIFGIFF